MRENLLQEIYEIPTTHLRCAGIPHSKSSSLHGQDQFRSEPLGQFFPLSQMMHLHIMNGMCQITGLNNSILDSSVQFTGLDAICMRTIVSLFESSISDISNRRRKNGSLSFIYRKPFPSKRRPFPRPGGHLFTN